MSVKIRCSKVIPLPGQENTDRAHTYCQRPEDHKGKCSINAKEKEKPKRCEAVHKGKCCGQPREHEGSHSYSEGAVIVSWETKGDKKNDP